MQEHRRQYRALIPSILLAYFVGRMYDALLELFVPQAGPFARLVVSFMMVVILGLVLYYIMYSGRKGFLKW